MIDKPLRGAPSGGPAGSRLGPLGVYVHFPWCLKKCPYCDFLSVAAERKEIPSRAYADAVIAELERRAPEIGPRTIASVFFGGGTPSLWKPTELGRVLAAILAHFARAGELEVTVECNPSSFDRELAEKLIEVGVNRVSIGVQGLEQGRLEFLGRLHDRDTALAAVRDALAAKVPQVSADLIFGVTTLSPEQAVSEALTVAELGLTHLSAYALTIEPGTQFGALAKRGKLPLLDEGRVAESFLALDAALSARGFEHYEISNYAREGHVARHNLGYWQGRDYLGLGTGAWGTVSLPDGRLRYRNTLSPERYLGTDWKNAALFSANGVESAVEPIDRQTELKERILLGLRLGEGVDLDQAGRETGVEPWTRERERTAQRLVARGRLQREGGRVWIPKEAWLFADGTIAELM